MLNIPESAYIEKQWRCITGQWIPIKDMDDKYLANTIKFINHYFDKCYLALGKDYTDFILKELNLLASERGLIKHFLDNAPYPYQDRHGKWFIWSFRVDKDVPYKP